MSKFDEILNSSNPSDALLGEQIDAISNSIKEKFDNEYVIEWVDKIEVTSSHVCQVGNKIHVTALVKAKEAFTSGENVFTLKRNGENVRPTGRSDLMCILYTGTSDAPTISDIYVSIPQGRMNMPAMAASKNYFITGMINI